MADKYWSEWAENTDIVWWNVGRKQLNRVIRMVNAWTLAGKPEHKAELLLRHIDMGLQTFASRDGGSEWAKELQEMADYIKATK